MEYYSPNLIHSFYFSMKLEMTLLLLVAQLRLGHSTIQPSPVIHVNSSSSNAVNNTDCWSGGLAKPCLTFDIGLQGLYSNRQGTLMIAPGNYSLMLSNFTYFYDMNDLSIQGGMIDSGTVSRKPSVTVYCHNHNGLAFVKVTALTIQGVTFSGCGGLRSSTSYNMNASEPVFMKIYVGLYFLYCRDLNLTFIEVVETPGIGVVIYNTVGTNVIHNSTFARNNFQPQTGYSGGGGLYIEFSFCDITTTACLKDDDSNVEPGYYDHSMYLISDSYFVDNYANITENDAKVDSFFLPIGRYHVALGRGGGLSFYIIGKAHDNNITIIDCVVANNKAIWGAGILIEFHDSAVDNLVQIIRSSFEDNSLYYNNRHDKGTGGGGARVAMFAFPENGSVIIGNIVSFHICKFKRNIAYYGGGLSFYTSKCDSSNNLTLLSSDFWNNSARLGSGVDISLFHLSTSGGMPHVLVDNCLFYLNNAFTRHLHGLLVGTGAIYIDSVPVTFTGKNMFDGNIGTALTATDTHINILSNSTLRFINNTGRYGGAMSLLGTTYVLTYPHTSLEFIENSAEFLGGAIYHYSSGERDLIGSGNCFIRYSNVFIPRAEWKSSFRFENNYADDLPNAIYASTVLPCVHGGLDWDTDTGANRVFCWNHLWTYDDQSTIEACHEQVKTAPNSYTIKPMYTSVPGESFNLNSAVYDDFHNAINGTSLFLLKILKGNNTSFQNNNPVNYDIVSHGHARVYGQPNSTVHIQIESMNPVVIQDSFILQLQNCPPGFHYKPPSTSPVGCTCAGDFNGYIRCNSSNFTSDIIRTLWIGKVPKHDELLVAGSPYIYEISNSIYVPLPKDPDDLDTFFCNQSNSEGVLCGSCKEGYGVTASVFEFVDTPCVKCPMSASYYTWFYYILACFVPTLIFFCIVFIFNMTVTFGPLNSFIFFAQVINSVTKVNADGMIPFHGHVKTARNVLIPIYDIWNLKFFDTWLPQFCLSPKLNSLDMLLLGYIRALFPLFLLIGVFSVLYLYNKGTTIFVLLCRPLHRCLARFRQFSKLRQSIIGGIAVFIIISYTQMTLISLLILTPSPLYNADGKEVDRVFYYEGDIPYDWSSYRYIIPAIIFTCIFVVVPPVLFGYPTLLKLFSFFTFHSINLDRFYPPPKVQALLDEFHGCYKDGSDGGTDCRWFSSLYFILRIALVCVYTTTSTWRLQYTVQTIFYLFVAFLFATFRPYRKDWINTVDITVFLILASICTISFFNLTNTWVGNPLDTNAVIVQEIFMGLPLVYCVCYCIVLIWSSVRLCTKAFVKSHQSKSKELKTKNLEISDDSISENYYIDHQRVHSYTPTSALEDSTHVPNFLEFIEESGRTSTTPETQSCPQMVIPNTNTSINSSVTESSDLLNNESRSRGFVKSVPWYRRIRRNVTTKPHTTSLTYGATN